MPWKELCARISFAVFVFTATPLSMYGFSTGPPAQRTGAPVDGGTNCTACHRTFAPANSGTGRITISTTAYTPGVKQNILITIMDPDAQRWGFQLTARLRSDENSEAGTFTVASPLRVRCADGSDAPCNGGKEFIEHTQPATQLGTRVQGTFTVEWTPPAQDAGEVIFYAAGNAANGDSTPNGDHIYTTSLVIRAPCGATTKPAVTGVTDAGSFRPSVSQGSLVSIFGGPFLASDFRYVAYANDLVSGKWPTSFGCVAVEIGGLRAPVFFVSKGQINAQVPALSASGSVDVVVILNPGAANETRSAAGKAQITAFSPALFMIDAKRIAAINASNQNNVVGIDGPAKPGDVVTFFGTGFGGSVPAMAPGEFPSGPTPLQTSLTITIGGVTVTAADILYSGLSPAAPGLCQFNVRIPASVADGDAVVKVRISGLDTQDGATLAIKR
ncbi:MAG: hypothetical protein C5B51_09295 [Terriglobia bacterium]|nr:MAG: hypothetical protein C5B51_09295 [Terriglobia bacterium]